MKILFTYLIPVIIFTGCCHTSNKKNETNIQPENEILPNNREIRVIDTILEKKTDSVKIQIALDSSIPFVSTLKFKSYSDFGSIWGNQTKRWILPKSKKNNELTGNLFGNLLPKLVRNKKDFIFTANELNYFSNAYKSTITHYGEVPFKSEGDREYFKRPIKSLKISPSFFVIGIGQESCKLISLDSIIGKDFYTYLPHGLPIYEPNYDVKNIPIVYNSAKISDFEIIVAITPKAKEKLDINSIKVSTEKLNFGNEKYPGTLMITKVDIDDNGETDIIKFNETLFDYETLEGNEGSDYHAEFIYLRNGNIWYRTSFYREGQEGVEGF